MGRCKFFVTEFFDPPYPLALVCIIRSYHCLHHQHSLLPQVSDKLIDVYCVLRSYPLQHGVQCDEGASPAHTSTAVHQQSVLLGVRMAFPHSPDEVDHGKGIGRHPMIRPG